MAIMMSSGKSRSMAAALLVVAVVACTCAAGVHAAPLTINNLSTQQITITTGTPASVTVVPNPGTATVPDALAFLVNPVTVKIGATGTPITIPRIVIDFIRLKIILGVNLLRLDINTVGNGVIIFATFPPLPLLPFLPPLVLPLGPFFP